MGMFDEIRCDYPLPLPHMQDHTFQTKSLTCELLTYTLDVRGCLRDDEGQKVDHTGEIRFYDFLDTDDSNSPMVNFVALMVAGHLIWIGQVGLE